jgi:hypothetical protein
MSFGPDYMISSFVNEAKLYDIEYVDDPQAEIQKLIHRTGSDGIVVEIPRVGSFKRKEWEIQQESRFKLTVHPVDMTEAMEELLRKDSPQAFNVLMKLFDSLGPSIASNRPISTTHIDLDLDPAKLADVEIMLGPLTLEADRIIVEALLKPFPNAVICDSVFKGKLRDKG